VKTKKKKNKKSSVRVEIIAVEDNTNNKKSNHNQNIIKRGTCYTSFRQICTKRTLRHLSYRIKAKNKARSPLIFSEVIFEVHSTMITVLWDVTHIRW
jgi:hypothetical protein